MNSPELREVYNATLPIITQYYAELGQNLALFDKFKALRNSPEFAGLSAARKKIIENELRDFRLGGAELPEDKKRELATQASKKKKEKTEPPRRPTRDLELDPVAAPPGAPSR
jgi:Zn-dependent oligopeptidase